jgi:aryl-alcohol dehydrogenase-like predicted oxidoreductase
MNYRLLGRTGVQVSPLCLGTFNFGAATPEPDAIRLIHQAQDRGINFVDVADYYNAGESERVVGKALEGRRDDMILATKFHFSVSRDPFASAPGDPNSRGNSRRHIINAVEASLKRLRTDWIDLYQIHRPDYEVPQEETLRALDDLVSQGKVRYIGTSTFPAWLVMEGLGISEKRGFVRFESEQPPYNLLDRRIENELVPLAERYGISILPWAALAIGMLAGRYPNASQFPADSRAARLGSVYAQRITAQAVDQGNKILPLAQEAGLTPSQLALLWTKDQPAVTAPLIGPRTEAQLEDALAIMDQALDPEMAQRLDAVFPPGSASADFYNTSGWMKMRI